MLPRVTALVLLILHYAAVADDSSSEGKRSKFFQLIGRDSGNIYRRPFSGSANLLDRFNGNGGKSSSDSSSGSTILNKLRGHGEGEKFVASFDVLVRHEGESSNKSGSSKKSKSEKNSKSKKERSESKEKRRQSSSKKSMSNKKGKKKKSEKSEGQRRAPTNSPIRPPSQIPARSFPSMAPSNAPSRVALRDGTQVPTVNAMVIQTPSVRPIPPTNSSDNSTALPTLASTNSSTDSTEIGVPRFFISAVSSDATESPTDDEFELIFNATEEYFNQVLFEEFQNIDDTEFIRFEMELNNTRFELGEPEPRFNLYMDFSASSLFAASSPTLPTAQEMFDALRVAINVTYITDILRAATGTPFAGTTEAFFASSSGIL